MSSINVYKTPQAIYVTKGSGSPNRNYPVNRTDFKIVDGVNNDIEVFIKDLDRKPVDMTGFTVTIIILNRQGDKLILQKDLVMIDPLKGRYRLVVDKTEELPLGTHVYSFLHTSDETGVQEVLETDRNRGTQSYVEVVEGPFVRPTPSVSFDLSQMLRENQWTFTPAVNGSALEDRKDGQNTIVIIPSNEGFSGTIKVQATLEAQPSTENIWFDVGTEVYSERTGAISFNVEGMITYLRVGILPETMATPVNIEKIIFRN